MRRGDWQTHSEGISLPGSHKGVALTPFKNTTQSSRTSKETLCEHGRVARLPVAALSPRGLSTQRLPVVQGLIDCGDPVEEGGKGQAKTTMWVHASPGLASGDWRRGSLIWAVAPVRCFP